MRRRGAILTGVAVGLALAGCGSDGGDSSSSTSSVASGPHLGDRCHVATTTGAQVEVQTVKGPLQCSEARSVLQAYYASAASNGNGSGAGLKVASWFCLTEPPTHAPLAGHCVEQSSGRRFEMYLVSAESGANQVAPTTSTTPAAPGPTESQAETAAQEAASEEVNRFGIGIPPEDFNANCTVVGADDLTWQCDVSSQQCSGPVTIQFDSATDTVGRATARRVGCLE